MRRTRFSKPLDLLLLSFLLAALSTSVMGCTDDEPAENHVNGGDAGHFDDVEIPDAHDDAGTDDTDLADVNRPSPDGGDEWNWDDDFALIAVSPARGPLSGGTQIQISGSGLTADTLILFGDQPVEVSTSQGQLIGQTPPAASAGPVTVRAISGDGETVELQNGYTYSDGLTVNNVVPSRLPTTGGVEITLQGKGFVEDMGVSFSGVPARRIDVVSGQLARVVAPVHPRGRADLRVSIPDETVLLEDAITFFVPLKVTEILPAAGDVDGGETVVLRGEGFTSTTEVYFGDVEAHIQSVNVGAGILTVTTPEADGVGPVDIFIETADDMLRLRDAFYYDDDSSIDALYSIYPASGPTTGGTEHIVSGRGLDASDAQILIGGQVATIVDSGPAYARVQAPSVQDPGLADVVFQRAGSDVDSIDDGFEYLLRPVIDEITPSSGSSDGGQNVSIFGQGFSDVGSIRFGGVQAAFSIVNDTEISVTTPRSEPGLVDVVVRNGTERAVEENGYRFEADLEVWSMRPSRGAIAGGTHVTIQGRGFEGLIEVDVGDSSASTIRRLDPYTITFRTPPSSTGPHDVFISAMGQDVQVPYPFVYFNPISSFGGASGAYVDGSVNVSVLNTDGTPIPGAFVMLSVRPDTPYRGYTDSNGQVTLSGPDVLGAQTVTATAADFSTVTVRHVDAQNITIILNVLEADGGGGAGTPPPMGHFSGTVTITGKSDDPAGGQDYNMSIVRTTRNHLLAGMMNPGANSIVPGEGAYEIRTRIGDMALIALCGVYDEETDVFTPKLMAVERYLFVSDGGHQQVDLECDIPLDEQLGIKIVDPVYAPTGPNINEAVSFLDFGYEGVYRMPGTARGLGDILVIEDLPANEGILDDVTFSVIAGSYTGAGVPYTQTTVEGISDLYQIHATRPLVAVPEPLDPAPGGVADGQIRLGLKGTNTPDFFYVVLRNAMGLPVWTFIVPGNETTIPLPEFPSFADLPVGSRPEPFQQGALYAVAYGIDIEGFDFDSFTYRDFNISRWAGFSVETWHMFLAD